MARCTGARPDFRYSCAGARHLFRTAGFEVEVVHKIGDTMITTGWLMGFGNADFEPERLARSLVNNRTKPRMLERDPQERLYVSCALVLRRPARPSTELAAPTGSARQRLPKPPVDVLRRLEERAGGAGAAPTPLATASPTTVSPTTASPTTAAPTTAAPTLLVGIISFKQAANRFRLERREWLRQLCPSRPPLVEVRWR